MAQRVGIDLGTTNSVVSYVKGGRPEVVANLQGEYWTPSVVQDRGGGQILVGKEAKDNMAYVPEATIWSIKRFIGRSPGDAELEKARKLVPYKVLDPAEGKTDLRVELGGKEQTPIEISAIILRKLIDDTAVALGSRPTEAVITVPAYFSERQKEATRQAGRLAGINVRRILDEPTAAALAYGMDLDAGAEKNLLVFDLGGGTFDVSVLILTGGQFTTLRITGDNFLGGDDFDNVILLKLLSILEAQKGVDYSGDPKVRAHLKKAAEQAKIALSSTTSHQVDTFIPPEPARPELLMISTRLERSWFEEECRPLVDRVMAQVSRALKEASMDAADIHHVLLVGGSSRIPVVQKAVEAVFGASRVSREMNPMLCVAQGAAILAETIGEGREEEVITRCTAKPMGIELADGNFDPIIQENTYYPLEEAIKQHYRTTGKNQRELRVSVFEGDAKVAAKNEWVGDVVAGFGDGLPEGVPVTVGFRIDRDGILYVTVDVEGRPGAVKESRVERSNRPRPPVKKPDDKTKTTPEQATRVIGAFLSICDRCFRFFPDQKKNLSTAVGRISRALENGTDAEAERAADEGMKMVNDQPPHLDLYFFGTLISQDSGNLARADKLRRDLGEADRACAANDFPAFEAALVRIQPLVKQGMDEKGSSGGAAAMLAGLRKA